jgi:hypothetical protein
MSGGTGTSESTPVMVTSWLAGSIKCLAQIELPFIAGPKAASGYTRLSRHACGDGKFGAVSGSLGRFGRLYP